jgi:hypothetical protein
VEFIRADKTTMGPNLTAELQDQAYRKGRTVSDIETGILALKPQALCPSWNYTLRHPSCRTSDSTRSRRVIRELIVLRLLSQDIAERRDRTRRPLRAAGRA